MFHGRTVRAASSAVCRAPDDKQHSKSYGAFKIKKNIMSSCEGRCIKQFQLTKNIQICGAQPPLPTPNPLQIDIESVLQ